MSEARNYVDLSDPRYEHALAEVDACTSIGELQQAVGNLIRPYGLRHVVYHILRVPHLEDLTHTAVVFTYPPDWISYYLQKRFQSFDPVVKTGEHSLLPFDWRSLDKTPGKVRRLFGEATDAGLGRQGLTIPLRGPSGDHALFTVTSDMSDADWSRSKPYTLRDMQVIAAYVHGRALSILKPADKERSVRLSSREQECLQWASVGKTIEDTATILSLSASAVRNYLDSARHKLDCLTKPHAVARALQLGIITF